jgi:SAM-dependent methyltransferase
MVRTARENLKGADDFHFLSCDVQSLPLATASFGAVIANHMLYHIPNIRMAISEIWRVLEPGGILYTTTNGVNHVKQIWEWTTEALPSRPDSHQVYQQMLNFSLDNGEQILAEQFGSVTRVLREDGLEVNEVQPIIDFIASSNFYSPLNHQELGLLTDYFEAKLISEMKLQITKNSGLFIARK